MKWSAPTLFVRASAPICGEAGRQGTREERRFVRGRGERVVDLDFACGGREGGRESFLGMVGGSKVFFLRGGRRLFGK